MPPPPPPPLSAPVPLSLAGAKKRCVRGGRLLSGALALAPGWCGFDSRVLARLGVAAVIYGAGSYFSGIITHDLLRETREFQFFQRFQWKFVRSRERG